VTRYRFLDGMGDVVGEHEFDDHRSALAAARSDADDEAGDPGRSFGDSSGDGSDDDDVEVQRVEYLGPDGDWRWAGPLEG
jgi:hypothetical protein